MALPTDGYAPTSVTYMLGTSNNLTVTVQVPLNSGAHREAFEEFQPFLETALNDLRTAYQSNTDPAQSVLYIERTYSGDVRGNMPEA